MTGVILFCAGIWLRGVGCFAAIVNELFSSPAKEKAHTFGCRVVAVTGTLAFSMIFVGAMFGFQ